MDSLPFTEELLLAYLNPSKAHSDLVPAILEREWIEVAVQPENHRPMPDGGAPSVTPN